MLLHGFTQTSASWDPVIARLVKRYRPLAPDIRGHGSAAARRPISFAACIADIAALSPEPFALVGYSMGGRLALSAALELGAARVARLTLIGASAGIADAAERRARRAADERLAAEIERSPIDEFVRCWAAQPLFAGQPAEVAAAAHADRVSNDPRALAAALRGLGVGAMEPCWDRLCELAMPVTLIAGERDEKFRATAEAMAPAIADVEVAIVPGCGHAPQLEAPTLVAQRV